MNLRVFPFSILIASALILCTAFQCSKNEPDYHASGVDLRFINNSTETVELEFIQFDCEDYRADFGGPWNAARYDTVSIVVYPMESISMRAYCFLTEEEEQCEDVEQLIYSLLLKQLNRGVLDMYEYDFDKKKQGDLLNKWPVRKAKEDNSIFNINRWSYYQIDQKHHNWNINLFE